jgi:acetyl coenzyme A synthetase (ADP forming)-like protein
MLESLLYPESIAIIGASANPGKVGYAVLSGLMEAGYEGKIVPVNRKADELLGLTNYKSIEEYGEDLDLAVIAVPTPAVKDAVAASLRKGVRAIIVITAGFKEVGPEGAELEADIARMCKQKGVRLMGPNVLGLINTHHKMNASFASQMPEPGGISIISQSGALCTAILDWAMGRHLGLGKLISIGNKADLNETDFLQVLARDEETKVIAGYLESIENGEEFLTAAEETCSTKPVVILKVGTTQAGAKAASSHTGSLAGGDIAYGAAFRRSGVIRADNFEELFDYATALYMQPLPEGERVAIITNAGGPGIMAADACERSGLQVSRLSDSTVDELRRSLPAAASALNPIDVLGDADPDRYAAAIKAAQADDHIDAIIVILTPQAMTEPAETARTIARCSGGDKPKIC